MKKILFLILFMGFVMNTSAIETNRYTVVGNNVNIREKPSLKSKTLGKLPAGATVYLKKTKSEIVKIGSMEGKWVYVDTRNINPQTNETYKGWMFDYFLLKNSKPQGSSGFEKVISIELERNTIDIHWLGEFGGVHPMIINNDGTFQVEVDSVKEKGRIYKYRSLYFAETDNSGIVFYIENLRLIPIKGYDFRCKPEYLKLKKMPKVVPCE